MLPKNNIKVQLGALGNPRIISQKNTVYFKKLLNGLLYMLVTLCIDYFIPTAFFPPTGEGQYQIAQKLCFTLLINSEAQKYATLK